MNRVYKPEGHMVVLALDIVQAVMILNMSISVIRGVFVVLICIQ